MFFHVKAPKGNGYTTPEAMKRIEDHLRQMNAGSFKGNPMPVQSDDGTWEVLVFNEKICRGILTQHYGLEIIREEIDIING
jgi:hypothetical protein